MGVNLDGLDMSKGNFMLTYNSAFTCVDNVFIEYHDIMRCIQFTIINFLRKNSIFKVLLDTSEIEDMTEAELYVWYISRENRNIFKNLEITSSFSSLSGFDGDSNKVYDFLDNFLYIELDNLPSEILNYENKLKFYDTMKTFLNMSTVKNIYIYSENYSKLIEEDVSSIHGDIKYVYGDFKSVLEENEIKSNTTFVFSDIEKINTLVELDILKFSTILMADQYRYNYGDDDELKVNVEKLADDHIFKLFFYTAFEILDENKEDFVQFTDNEDDDNLDDIEEDVDNDEYNDDEDIDEDEYDDEEYDNEEYEDEEENDLNDDNISFKIKL